MEGITVPPVQDGGTSLQDNNLSRLLLSHRVIFRARTVFPFELFPSEIIITENEVHFVKNIFLNTSETTSISIKDINTCSCSTSMVFGAVRIELLGEIDHRHTLHHLWRDDALHATRIINGLRHCVAKRVDLSQYDTKSIQKHMAELGRY